MFKLFKKNITQYLSVEANTTYPKVVHEIHNEFMTAGDKLIQEAKSILEGASKKQMEKGKRLKAIGFQNVVESKNADKLIETVEVAKKVEYYRCKYPFQKFITEQQLLEICKKYQLICGEISMYSGFVPETKLQEIENFKVSNDDVLVEVWSRGVYAEYKTQFLNDNGVSAEKWSSLYKKENVKVGLKICAPSTDMIIPSGKEVKWYKVVASPIPDPVVLQPVNGGYLIVTAWGDEASDELVVNQTNN